MKNILVAFFLLFSTSSFSKTDSFISAGISATNFFFTVTDKKDKTEAEMVNKLSWGPSIGFQTVPRPFWSSLPWLGGAIGFSVGRFKADHQGSKRFLNSDGSKPDNGLDLDTEVKGFVSYIAPALLLMHTFSERSFIYGGVGFGVGYASVNGSYYQTDNDVSNACLAATQSDGIKSNCPKERARFSGFSTAVVVMGGISLGSFGFKIEGGGPVLHFDDKKFTTSIVTGTFQYQHFLD